MGVNMELLKLTRNGANGATIAHIWDDGCFIQKSFYGYSIQQVFAILRNTYKCTCSNRLKRIARS